MDPKSKNATQPFVYYTNKAVTKARERDFPSLFEASFFVSCACDPLILVFIIITSRRIRLIHEKVAHTSSRYIFLALLFPFLPSPFSVRNFNFIRQELPDSLCQHEIFFVYPLLFIYFLQTGAVKLLKLTRCIVSGIIIWRRWIFIHYITKLLMTNKYR